MLDSLIAESSTEFDIKPRTDMPAGVDGLCIGKTIIINANRTRVEQAQTLAEEISHQEISVGDILNPNDIESAKQETVARRRSFNRLVPLDKLVAAYWRSTNEFELADHLDVTVEYLFDVLAYYREKYGVIVKDNILINFANGIQILKA
ncbi:ImmA/IrrE family metallo-endopeptidase [Latilactobacillus curvatus]|uniref:ImmA/IrrE family metallo-endopeptidase n=1 Tax=Latilactobacillus curvatus TaxID=28038 RepID=UPI0022F3DF01|nr:ImmA/IrrE family metallo-endopeptidase [Latilactobacillus curvatus]WBY48588.1 ImmA/IrrE family metallo-endopeptidase [Latilactobacillus curvatus]